MKKEQVPENAIDRFFYKISRAIKGSGKTIIESITQQKVIKMQENRPYNSIIRNKK